MTDRTHLWLVAAVAALGAALVAGLQLRHGVLQLLDTGSYVSGASAIRHGHPFTTTLAPSFSNFSAIEFLDRRGRLPFVDFPIGYPLLAAPLTVVMSVRRALGVVVVLASAALAAAVVLGPSTPRHRATAWFRAGFAVVVLCMPVYRLVVQGALSEPLFCAAVVGLAAALIRYRRDGSAFGTACVLAGAAGLLRFVGGVVAVLPAIEHFRRNRDAKRALLAGAACVAPVALNVALAGAAGGGHTAHWHGIDRVDVRLVARSASGWFSTRTGDLAVTLLRVGDQLPWWAAVIGVVWVVAALAAVAGWIGLVPDRLRFPAPLELCLAMAALLTVALLAGVAVFDALATPDNRIMLPAGVLTLCGLVWSVDVGPARLALPAAALALWAWWAAPPWQAGRMFGSTTSLALARQYAGSGVGAIISNNADGVFWETGIPSAYLPPQRLSLTDEPVDRAALYEQLPCALQRANGLVVVFADSIFGVDGQQYLDDLVAQGRLAERSFDGGTEYRAGPEACPA